MILITKKPIRVASHNFSRPPRVLPLVINMATMILIYGMGKIQIHVDAFTVYRPYRGRLDDIDIEGWRIKGYAKDARTMHMPPTKMNGNGILVGSAKSPPHQRIADSGTAWSVQELSFHQNRSCSIDEIITIGIGDTYAYSSSGDSDNAPNAFDHNVSTSWHGTNSRKSSWIGFRSKNNNFVSENMRCIKIVQGTGRADTDPDPDPDPDPTDLVFVYMSVITIQAYTYTQQHDSSSDNVIKLWRDVYVVQNLSPDDREIDLGNSCYKDSDYVSRGFCDANIYQDRCEWGNAYCNENDNDADYRYGVRHDSIHDYSPSPLSIPWLTVVVLAILFLIGTCVREIRTRNDRIARPRVTSAATRALDEREMESQMKRKEFIVKHIHIGKHILIATNENEANGNNVGCPHDDRSNNDKDQEDAVDFDVDVHNLDDSGSRDEISVNADATSTDSVAGALIGDAFTANGAHHSQEAFRARDNGNNVYVIHKQGYHESCPICFEVYKAEDNVAWSRNTKCLHSYHAECILEWLMNHNECPTCRSEFVPTGMIEMEHEIEEGVESTIEDSRMQNSL